MMEYNQYKAKQKKEAEELAEQVANFVNRFDSKESFEAFAEKMVHNTHRTLQQSTMRLFMTTIEKWAENERFSDGRNEATIKLAKEIVKTRDDKELYLPFI